MYRVKYSAMYSDKNTVTFQKIWNANGYKLLSCQQKGFFIVYCKLQSTQLDRVISKVEVRKGREAGTIHQWFTAVVLLG